MVGAQEELRIAIPSFRRDLKREEDLIEEVARIHGYDKIPTTIPKMVGHTARKCFMRQAEEHTRAILTGAGLDEIISYYEDKIYKESQATISAIKKLKVMSKKVPLTPTK